MRSITNELAKLYPTQYNKPFDFSNVGFVGGLGGNNPWDFEELYGSSTGWTLSANMTISSGKLNYTAVPHNAETSYKDMGITLSDTLWYADWDYNETSDTASDNHGWAVFCLVAGTTNPVTGTVDAFKSTVIENFSAFRWIGQARDGSTDTNTSVSTDLAQTTQYYPRTLRTSATGDKFQVFSNSIRTTEAITALTATIPSTAGLSLTHLHHSSGSGAGGTQTVTAVMDNVRVYNAVSP